LLSIFDRNRAAMVWASFRVLTSVMASTPPLFQVPVDGEEIRLFEIACLGGAVIVVAALYLDPVEQRPVGLEHAPAAVVERLVVDAGEGNVIELGAAVAVLTEAVIEDSAEHPTLSGFVPFCPCVAHDVVTAAAAAEYANALGQGRRRGCI